MGKKKNEPEENNHGGEPRDGEIVVRLVIPEELSFLFSEEVMGHLLSAKKELLLAFRGIIDHKLRLLEKKKVNKVKTVRVHVE